jgi:hypothetical protein
VLQFHTTVLERLKPIRSSFDTEPYEAGWAREAMFFVRIHDISGAPGTMTSAIQVSADGIMWVDEGTTFTWPAEPAVCFARVTHFGGWLRLRNTISGGEGEVKTTIQLVLKG